MTISNMQNKPVSMSWMKGWVAWSQFWGPPMNWLLLQPHQRVIYPTNCWCGSNIVSSEYQLPYTIRMFRTHSAKSQVGSSFPRLVPTRVKCKNPGIKRWGSAWDWDAYVPSRGPPIGRDRASAAEATNMAGMANWAYQPCGGAYTTYMCRHCCH